MVSLSGRVSLWVVILQVWSLSLCFSPTRHSPLYRHHSLLSPPLNEFLPWSLSWNVQPTGHDWRPLWKQASTIVVDIERVAANNKFSIILLSALVVVVRLPVSSNFLLFRNKPTIGFGGRIVQFWLVRVWVYRHLQLCPCCGLAVFSHRPE